MHVFIIMKFTIGETGILSEFEVNLIGHQCSAWGGNVRWFHHDTSV
jgi:hypothetical protein